VDQLLTQFGNSLQGILSSSPVQLTLRAVGLYVVLLWLGAAFWAFRDAGRRTHNLLVPYAAGALVILATPVFFPFALILYAIVRPSETLVEAWERRMAEEAAAETVPLCATCGRRTDPDWIACPSCGQRLHHRCASCGRLMGLDWALCAWCGADPAASSLIALRRPEAVPAVAPADERAASVVGSRRIGGAPRAPITEPVDVPAADGSDAVAAFAPSHLPVD
jgi:predicted RNA-binding Zn-ribbon protein involved in translation (DUF1610 family)